MFCKSTLAAAIALVVTAVTPSLAADLGPDYSQPRAVWCPRFCNGAPVSFGYGLCYQRKWSRPPGDPACGW